MRIPVLLCGEEPFVYLKRDREVAVDPGAHFDPGMGPPVKIASAGDQKRAGAGKFQRVGLLLFRKHRVIAFEAVKSISDQP